MATGLLALLDDVTALVKVTAASLDDVPLQIAKTGGKVSGIVIDDAAVTPKYVVGLDPKRELAIIWNITRKSLFNKLILLAPAVMLLGWFAPFLITPLLMIGGAYLCFEGYEKVHTMLAGHGPEAAEDVATPQITPEDLEKERTAGAVRTDFILSAEIIAIAYSTVSDMPLASQIAVLVAIAVGITLAVYGFVALIVKADDLGLWLARTSDGVGQAIGRFIVRAMPMFLSLLSYVGTAAMLWVGAGIIAHGIPEANHWLHVLHDRLAANEAMALAAEIAVLLAGGLGAGFLIALLVAPVLKLFGRPGGAH